jgi:hypothetical protein
MPSLSAGAIIFLLIEAAFFGILVHCILKAQRYLGPILSSLSRSLRVSEDLFGDERNFVTSARTRYRRAAERIQDVDAHAIASGELGSFELLKLGKWRMNIGALAELMGSAPAVFITLGLLGTFVGLALNLSELSSILDSGDGSSASPGDLVQRMSGVLAPMSTAFISSLGGVFFSLLFWLISLVLGSNRLLDETETLLTAYLEQIVQADCNRFSLMSASLERMELCLAEFMSKFGERVGVAIDTAMNSKISQVFDSIKKGADALDIYSQAFNHGIRDLSNSGQAFAKASQVFSESDFASKFGSATISFRESLSESTRTANSFSAALSDFTSKSEQIGKEWQEVSSSLFLSTELANKVLSSTSEYANNLNTAYSELSEAAKQLRAARLAIGRENKQSDELSRALLIELDNSRPSREELMQLIQTISGQLQNRTIIDSRLTDLIQMNLRVEGLDASERSKLNLLLDTLLNASAGAL